MLDEPSPHASSSVPGWAVWTTMCWCWSRDKAISSTPWTTGSSARLEGFPFENKYWTSNADLVTTSKDRTTRQRQYYLALHRAVREGR